MYAEQDGGDHALGAKGQFKDGLRYSPETKYSKPHNSPLMNSMNEMIDGLLSGRIVVVPVGTILNQLARLRTSMLNVN